MLIIRTERLRVWMQVTRKSQKWLANMYGVNESYISLIMHNRTPISGNFIGFILSLTNMNFDDLFLYDGSKDTRRFYGKMIICDGKVLKPDRYYAMIENKLGNHKKVLDIEKFCE